MVGNEGLGEADRSRKLACSIYGKEAEERSDTSDLVKNADWQQESSVILAYQVIYKVHTPHGSGSGVVVVRIRR